VALKKLGNKRVKIQGWTAWDHPLVLVKGSLNPLRFAATPRIISDNIEAARPCCPHRIFDQKRLCTLDQLSLLGQSDAADRTAKANIAAKSNLYKSDVSVILHDQVYLARPARKISGDQDQSLPQQELLRAELPNLSVC
jgi:hypothetical protein